MRNHAFFFAALVLVVLPNAYACESFGSASSDDASDGGADAIASEGGDAALPIDDEPPASDAGTFADVIGLDASFTPCGENGLVARWRFDDDPDATTVADCSGNANHGLRLGGTLVAPAPAIGTGTALSLPGGAWVGFGNPQSLNLSGAFTASAWIKPGDMNDTHYIVGKSNDYSISGWRLAYRSQAGRNLSFAMAFDDPTLDGCFAIGGSAPVGQWTHVAGVFRPNEALEVYVGGVLVAKDPGCAKQLFVPSPVEARVGARSDGAATFIGDIDDVRVYGRAVASAEIEALANAKSQ